ncbi:MAG: DsrE family protein [Rhodocyclaceae bacterium]|jgi:intracellular sulfur oxidation DsrE/DsrF family protein|nr:DsrE family protein [Rhodocyclaceae bacterium]
MRTILTLALAALIGGMTLPAFCVGNEPPGKLGAGKTAPVPQNRIVIQINEDDGRKWMAVLANIRNIQAELGRQNVALAVVVIGSGLGMLKADSVAANDVQDALAAGVEFIACGNSMQAQHITQDDLIDGVKVAKAGYVEIVKRQQAGWSYLRP